MTTPNYDGILYAIDKAAQYSPFRAQRQLLREAIQIVQEHRGQRGLQPAPILYDPDELARLREAALAIRKSDCGAWLKDCDTQLFTCRDGREKRLELMRALDGLYKALNGDGDGRD